MFSTKETSSSKIHEMAMPKFNSTTFYILGLNIHHQAELYPPEWDNWAYYLESGELKQHNAYIFPLLKNIPKEKKILNTSRYAKVVRRFCPMTAYAQGDDFEWLNDFKTEDYIQNNNITRDVITAK